MIQSPKFSDAYEGYLLAQRARNLSQTYIALLARTRNYWLEHHGDTALCEITPDHIRLWMVRLQESGQGGPSVDIHYRNSKAFWFWCEKEELIDKAPIRKVDRPKFAEKVPDILSEGEALDLLDKVRNSGDRNAYRDYCMLSFLMDTGVRVAELARLSLADVNLSGGYARVKGKGDKERLVPLGFTLREDLSRYRLKYRRVQEGEDAFFVNEYGLRFGNGGIKRMVERLQKKYVERPLNKYGPHSLRHYFVTHDLLNNGDVNETAKIAGHSDTRTTKRYDHSTVIDNVRRISPIDKMKNKKKRRSF